MRATKLRVHLVSRNSLGIQNRVAVDDAPPGGAEINPAVNARVSGYVVDAAELMVVVFDAHPSPAAVVEVEESLEQIHFAGQINCGSRR